MKKFILFAAAALFWAPVFSQTRSTENGNTWYPGNRMPLAESKYIKLPVGSIEPGGWLKVYLDRQRDGLTGQLVNISAWLQKTDNAWLSNDGKGKWGWEEVPYWLKGYGNLAYILKDEAMIAEAKIWIEAVLSSQKENGDFGPHSLDQGKQDFWPNMIMLYCLQSYFEYSGDKRVIGFMTRYFKYQLSVTDEDFLQGYWQGLRSGDNLYSVIWLYNRTGEPFLLQLGEKIHRCGTSWILRHNEAQESSDPNKIPEWYKLLPDWHNVNVAQGFREPAIYSLLSHSPDDLEASYEVFQIMREHFGQVPGGMYGADENARPGYSDPRQAIETCGIVEQMNSDENMLCITGDNFWADHAEKRIFGLQRPTTVFSLHCIARVRLRSR
ncbi:MAG: glycoside hydrolase family 127 protein [Bacteroidia bacterium]|nr:glycoside hydrolase family 127 protein [Bacteroidia bacterium]